jgi:hypothetical protein
VSCHAIVKLPFPSKQRIRAAAGAPPVVHPVGVMRGRRARTTVCARPRSKGTIMAAAPSDTPVLDTLAAMTAESVARCDLDANSLMAARIAALAAVDAPPGSYLMNLGPATDAGVTLEQVQGILVAVAPIIGTPRTVNAAANIASALGVAVMALEAELEAEEAQA